MGRISTDAWCAGTLGIVLLVAVVNVIYLAEKIPPPPVDSPAGPTDPVMRHERRFAGLRANLQDRGLRGAVGYLADYPLSRLAAADPHGLEDCFLTQFVLAPLLLDFEAEHPEWIVANLRGAAPLARVPAGWIIVEDFGNGVLLLRRAKP